MSFFLGLDIGQVHDPTVSVVLEAHGAGEDRVYDIRHIDPVPLGTSYPAMVETVSTLLARSPLQDQCRLVIDHTSVGRPIFDMFVAAGLQPIGVTITPGKTWHQEDWNQYHVAKEILVATVQKFLQSRRLRGSGRVPHTPVLQRELQNFRVNVTNGLHEVYGPDVRENAHDDMVLATAVALWYAESQNLEAVCLAPETNAEIQRAWRQQEPMRPRTLFHHWADGSIRPRHW